MATVFFFATLIIATHPPGEPTCARSYYKLQTTNYKPSYGRDELRSQRNVLKTLSRKRTVGSVFGEVVLRGQIVGGILN